MSTFANRFTEALEAKKVSRRELARLSGVHVNTLNKWAAGEVPNPHPKQLRRAASVLGVTYEWLRLGYDLRASERIEPRGPYLQEEGPFDPELMQQVIRLVEDQHRLFRRPIEEDRVAAMEHAYRRCVKAGFTGQQEISMSRFLELMKEE